MDGSTSLFHKTTSITFILLLHVSIVSSNGVFKVQHKFAGSQPSLNALKEHDRNRHGRLLSTMDLPLGGIGDPSQVGLYYAKISLGTPAKDYYVHVDTGSDILWVNCKPCTNCPSKSSLGIDLTLYNPLESGTSKEIGCNQEFCGIIHQGSYADCKANETCQYRVEYGDGSVMEGFFVEDYIQYKQAIGDSQTYSANASFIFGCGTKQSDQLVSSNQAVDGILGFGQSNSSMISQLASAGKMKKVFSHCLDGINGGGIFAIGRVAEPKVQSTPLVPNMPHYNINLRAVKVGKDSIPLFSGIFDLFGDTKGTVVDSGTTLAYLPDNLYQPMMRAILASQPNLKLQTQQRQFQCFDYTNGNVDDGFPVVTFTFEGSLNLVVYPRDYLFKFENQYCFGWQSGGSDAKDLILLGDIVLSNKLVVYDLEKQIIGWAEYNCSSSIKLQDDKSGTTYQVGYHDLVSSASSRDVGNVFILLVSVIFHIASL